MRERQKLKKYTNEVDKVVQQKLENLALYCGETVTKLYQDATVLYIVQVKKTSIHYHDFEVDKLTRSIENVATGDSFSTDISYFLQSDVKQVTKKNGWLFNWKTELNAIEKEVYKLTIQGNPTVIQGLISLTVEPDHVYMHLIESAPFNKGKSKVYLGVPGNLVAYACRLSFQKGFDGFVSFHAKTKLIDHYIKSLGAYHFGGHLMIIDTLPAKTLIEKYFKQ